MSNTPLKKGSNDRAIPGADDKVEHVFLNEPGECAENTVMTCEALCSLSCSPPPASVASASSTEEKLAQLSSKCCPKQHQLPMFLSKTYHMIDRCDPTVATWSPSGDNFVVKNVEKFAQDILPMYFKHSNFSSFARQLNFYGFRKLKAEPILTADFDARTACYVRFYHEKFQKGQSELWGQIKRATKSEMQSKDDVDGLRGEICRMKDHMQCMSVDFDRRLSEMSYDYNRRITNLSVEYDKLAGLVQQLIATKGVEAIAGSHSSAPDMLRSLTHAALSLQGSMRTHHDDMTVPAATASYPAQDDPTSEICAGTRRSWITQESEPRKCKKTHVARFDDS